MALLNTGFSGFAAPARDARASLVIVHGLAEYAGRYRDIARFFNDRGLSCFAHDQQGHGASVGARTHVSSFEEFVSDLKTVIGAVRMAHPQPLFLWGHSMGSVVATLAAADAGLNIAGCVTSSASLEIFRRGPNPLNPLLRLGARIAPGVRIPLRLDPGKISSDPKVQAAYAADPNIPTTASLRLIVEFAAACERSREAAPRITAPWLLAHGEADQIAPPAGSQELFNLLGSSDKELLFYPRLRHELHNEREPERTQFLEQLAGWVLSRAG